MHLFIEGTRGFWFNGLLLPQLVTVDTFIRRLRCTIGWL